MDFRSIFYSCLTVFLIDFSCDTHVEIPVSVKVPIDYTALENELLRDSALAGREELIRSVVEFYRMEIPNQFSRRISLGNGRTDKVFLDEMVDKQIDSLRETLKPTTRIAFQNIVDSQIVDTVYLIDNIRSALSSADKYPWNRSIPDSIFLNYLLPYKVVHEYPGTWRSHLYPYYKDSLSRWSSPSHTGFDASDAAIIEEFTINNPRGMPMWWTFDDHPLAFTKFPSLKEILLLKKGGCYLGAMINVLILRTCGIPATIDEAPYWGSMNGSHGCEVLWNAGQQKMLAGSGLEFYDQSLNRRAPKVIRHTFRYTGAYSDEIAPYLKGEELQIPQMTGDHWFDATRDYMAVSNIDIPVSENITKKIDLGYIPGTLDFGRFLRGKMAHIFITKPRQN